MPPRDLLNAVDAILRAYSPYYRLLSLCLHPQHSCLDTPGREMENPCQPVSFLVLVVNVPWVPKAWKMNEIKGMHYRGREDKL